MSISDNYSPDKSLGNGVTDTFTGSWKVLSSAYFRCALESVATGVQTLLTNGSDYTLTFDDNGYSAVLATPPSSSYYVIRYREIEQDQTNPYKTSKGFQGEVLENSLDKVTGMVQEQDDKISRSLKFRVGSSSTDLEMDDPVDGRCMKWDATSGKYVNSGSDPDTIAAQAEAARDAAIVAQGLSEDARDASVVAQGLAEDARDDSAGYASDASDSSDLAEDWATKLSAKVDGSENSAKAYAQENLGVSGRDEGGSAKDWATTAEDQVVSDGLYSAKHYAAKAAEAATGGIKISSGDTTAGYAENKLLAGRSISATKGNSGGNETLTFALSTVTDDVIYAYPSVWSTFASIMADIKKNNFQPGKRAIIRIDSGHTIAEQFTFKDGDFRNVVIDYLPGRVSIRSATYRWTLKSGSEYFLELASGGDPSISEPDIVRSADSLYYGGLPKGTVGSLAAGSWGYGSSGTGFNTIIVRMKDDSDPDAQAAGSITYENSVPLDMSGFSVAPANYLYRMNSFSAKPWLIVENASGPVLDCRVDGESGTNTGTDKYGAMVMHGSMIINRGCGFEDFAGAGLWAFCSRITAAYGYFEGVVNAVLLYDSILEAERSTIKTTTGFGLHSQFNSSAMIDSATVNCTSGYCIYANESNVSFGSGVAVASNSANDQIYASNASTINCHDSSCTITSGNGSCFSSSRCGIIDAAWAIASESGSGYGYKVANGGIIAAHGATGSLSQTKNTIAAAGIIFQN